MKKLTEKQKKFVKKAAIAGSGILSAYLAYKAGRKDGFEDGCFYAADCFTNELMSGGPLQNAGTRGRRQLLVQC